MLSVPRLRFGRDQMLGSERASRWKPSKHVRCRFPRSLNKPEDCLMTATLDRTSGKHQCWMRPLCNIAVPSSGPETSPRVKSLGFEWIPTASQDPGARDRRADCVGGGANGPPHPAESFKTD